MKKIVLLIAIFSFTLNLHGSTAQTPEEDIDPKKQDQLNKELLVVAKSKNSWAKFTKIQELLSAKAMASAEEKNGKSALWWVVKRANLPDLNADLSAHCTVQLLIDQRAPLITTNNKFSCLVPAIENQNISIIKTVVDAHADLNFVVPGASPLPLIYIIDPKSMKLQTAQKIFSIFSASGRLDLETQHNYIQGTAVSMAHRCQNTPLVSLLLSHGANPYYVVDNHHYDVLDTAIAQQAHKDWKDTATSDTARYIPVPQLVEMVMNYCFWDSRKSSSPIKQSRNKRSHMRRKPTYS